MLPPGNYRVKFEAAGFQTLEMPSTTVGATEAVVDGKVVPGAGLPSLGDLGFTPEQAKSNPQEQARLDKRSHMLRTHQRLGLITTAPLVAALFTSAGAKDKMVDHRVETYMPRWEEQRRPCISPRLRSQSSHPRCRERLPAVRSECTKHWPLFMDQV